MEKAIKDILSDTSDKKLTITIIRQRIKLINGLSMSEDLFNQIADEFAEDLFKTMGENLNKLQVFAPMNGKYWQLQYVA
jgi:hypothetical protein